MFDDVPPPPEVDAIIFAYYGVLAPPAPRLGELATAAVADPAFLGNTGLAAAAAGPEAVHHVLPVVGYAIDQRADETLDADCHVVPAATVVYETLLAIGGEPPSHDAVASVVKTFGRLEALPMDDERATVVRGLREAGLRLGCICDCMLPGEFLQAQWTAKGEDALFDVVMHASDWGWRMPHPSIFRETVERMDCKPEEVLLVCGDFRTHLRGAEELGLRTVWLRTDMPERVEQVGHSYVVRDLGILLDWFAGNL